jgi:hypothetical protein
MNWPPLTYCKLVFMHELYVHFANLAKVSLCGAYHAYFYAVCNSGQIRESIWIVYTFTVV